VVVGAAALEQWAAMGYATVEKSTMPAVFVAVPPVQHALLVVAKVKPA